MDEGEDEVGKEASSSNQANPFTKKSDISDNSNPNVRKILDLRQEVDQPKPQFDDD